MERKPCNPTPECRVLKSEGGCREDVHHLYYPRRAYKTKLERQFRNLDENKILVCRALHNHIHATQEPPGRPSIDYMQGRVENPKTE